MKTPERLDGRSKSSLPSSHLCAHFIQQHHTHHSTSHITQHSAQHQGGDGLVGGGVAWVQLFGVGSSLRQTGGGTAAAAAAAAAHQQPSKHACPWSTGTFMGGENAR